jgi:hypothetical protein
MIFECFDRKYGAKTWPSDDPKDSPFDIFTCKICGKKFRIQMFGARYIYEPTFEDSAREELQNHMKEHIW